MIEYYNPMKVVIINEDVTSVAPSWEIFLTSREAGEYGGGDFLGLTWSWCLGTQLEHN